MIESLGKVLEGMKKIEKTAGAFKDKIPDFRNPNAGGMGGFKDKIPDFSKKETLENKEKGGGAYKDLPSKPDCEKHHIPADSSSDIPTSDGPAIVMDKGDHRQTASCGNSREAQEYRAKQKELINEGKFEEAQQMDIDDIKEKFGSKYDDQIAEMKDYTNKLLENKKGV